ncbi:MAG TPA: hypothetical protein VMK12_11485 [Anaeromyxobacteraceae bacterium]|nr:hypothetical protein [Anaeromyxobacteraceae bacterium]
MLPASLLLLGALHGNFARAGNPASDPLAVAHSHNDYEQRVPLFDALRAGFESVEADVWVKGGEIVVSHLPFFNRGRLEDLYLRPLQERVDRMGSVHGDGRPFYLWIDIKESTPELTDALFLLLERYKMFTVFTDEEVVPGPVVAVLTGDEAAKARYADGHHVRRACRDSNRFRLFDPAADRRWTWYALPWGEVVSWDGSGPGLTVAMSALRALVLEVHRLGRRIRLYGVPEKAEAWAAAVRAGVDQVGTDRIDEFRAFLLARGGNGTALGVSAALAESGH